MSICQGQGRREQLPHGRVRLHRHAPEHLLLTASDAVSGAEVVGASVGAVGTPVSVNAFQDLQSQVEHLQRQAGTESMLSTPNLPTSDFCEVLELSRRQDLMQEVSTKACEVLKEPAGFRRIRAICEAAPEAVVPDVQHSGSTGPIPELI